MTARDMLLSEIIEKELERVGTCREPLAKEPGLGTLGTLSHALANLDHALREKMQEETRGEMETIIGNLERDGPLSSPDRDLIRTWMVGDAEFYTRVENNFDDWKAELNRLLEIVSEARGRRLSPTQMVELQASVRDALRTASDVQFYQEQRARVTRFKEATADWSRDDKQVLARLLRSKLASDEG